MSVRYGIVCDRCRKLLLVSCEGKSSRLRYDKGRKEFKLICIAPCPNVIFFSKSMLVPYVVPDEAVKRGYAEIDDCRPVAGRA